jgi:hypothetical protein
MRAPRHRFAWSFVAVLTTVAITACGGSGTEPGGGVDRNPSNVAAVSGNNQTGLFGSTLSTPLVVKVTTSAGAAVSGATVTFAVASGAASVSPATVTTDSSGRAQTTVTLGSEPGTVQINATVSGTSLTTTFTVVAGAGTTSTACSTGAPQSIALGGVLPSVGGTGICLSGGTSGAEYALIAFNSSPDSELVATHFTVQSTGTNPVVVANAAPSFNAAPGATSPLRVNATDTRSAFDARLRGIASRELAPHMADARARLRTRAALNVIPAQLSLNQIITLNGNGLDACDNPINVRARVVAISNTAIVVADTTNPAGGFTDAEYQSFATTFDTTIAPLDIGNFGQPTDIDKNGKVVIFFTKEVNKLTPRNNNGGVIGGFFFERDLFPRTSTTNFDGCAGSNYGEMFYVLVPDPNAVFSDKRTKADVLSLTPGTIAHEFQHLINAGRRLYVNNADFFETVWLNEGLSHVAEELLYYEASGLRPRTNINSAVIRSTTASVNAFNDYQSDNFGRYEVFLEKPSATNVHADNDSLETRGATWNLLRYLADHRGPSDADTWSLLVNSNRQGIDNLANVFGADVMTQITNWATSVFSDDLAGVNDPRFLEQSWNMRDIFPNLGNGAGGTLGRFPLQVVPLSSGTTTNASIVAGGAEYCRFGVNAGSQASIDWAAGGLPVSPEIRFTVVRTR